MAEQINPYSITAPGFWGLNIQDSPVGLNPNFALVANNCVIDKSGRIASRKGWTKVNSANTDLSTSNVTCIGELIENGGTSTLLATGGAFLFKLSGSTLTTLTYGGGGVAPTISASNWKFCQLNGVAIFWQSAHDPLIYEPAVSTTTFRRLNERSGSVGTVPQANTAISAYGRIWAANTASDKNTVTFSDVLAPHIWTGGTAGTLDLIKAWPRGGDEVVALAAHNNFLYIFGKNQILVYEGAMDPATMKLADTIIGVGCIARDSVQVTGQDIIFLSSYGVMSLMRTIQEKSQPFRPISKNVLEEIQSHSISETLANVKSIFSPNNSFYLLTMPTFEELYCFDMKGFLEDGSSRVTTWTGISPKCLFESNARDLYLGQAGFVGKYDGYVDNASSYRMSYYGAWLDFGNPIQKSILKKIKLTINNAANRNIIVKYGFDFNTTYRSETVQISDVATYGYYGVSEYNTTAEYASAYDATIVSANCGGEGMVLQFGIETEINGSQFSIQKIDIFTKDGRL